MRPHPPVHGLFKDESKGVAEFLVGAEPDEFVGPQVGFGPEEIGELLARCRIDAVGGDDEIVIGHQPRRVGDFGFEIRLHAEFARAFLQDSQQPLPSDAAKAVACGNGAAVPAHNRNIVPKGETLADRGGARRVVRGQVIERFFRQHHAPAECVAGPVAFEYRDRTIGVAHLHTDRGVQSSRTAAADRDTLHSSPISLHDGECAPRRRSMQDRCPMTRPPAFLQLGLEPGSVVVHERG